MKQACFCILVCMFFLIAGRAQKIQKNYVKDSIEWALLKDAAEGYAFNYNDSLDKALFYAKKTVDKAGSVFGKKSKNYGLSLVDLSSVYWYLQKYDTAKLHAQTALLVIKNAVGLHDSDYATALNVYAIAEQKLGNYNGVEKAFKEMLAIREQIFGQNSPDYVQSLNNLGNFYISIEDFPAAEKNLKMAADIQYKLTGNDYFYSMQLSNLAYLYVQKNEFSQAEHLYRQAIAILDTTMDTTMGIIDPSYAEALNGLASLYTSMNNYSAAENAHKIVLNVVMKLFNRKTLDYGTTSIRLAKLYINTGNYDTAFVLLNDAAEVYSKEIKSGDSVLYPELFDEFAHLYAAKGDLEKAALYYGKAINVKERNGDDNTPSYATSLNNLGALMVRKGNYTTARQYLEKAAGIRLKKMGYDNPDYAESVNNMLSLYYARQDGANWQQSIRPAINTWQNSVMHLLLSFGENEKENYLGNHLQARDMFLSMLYYFKQHGNVDSIGNVYFKMITALQGWLLTGSQQLNAAVVNEKDSLVLDLYNQWIFLKTQYSGAVKYNEEKQKQLHLNADSLLLKVEQVEMNLISRLPALQDVLKNTGSNPAAVARSLAPGEALVNWVSFKYMNPQDWTDSVLYGAFIILPGDTTAHFTALFEQRDLQKLLDHYHNYGGRGIVFLKPSMPMYKNIDSALYRLIWQPLLGYIGGAKKIYMVPSGLLNKISFSSLADTSNKPLLETTELHILSNVNDIAKTSERNKPVAEKISLLGGAYFDGENSTQQNAGYWQYLPGTAKEVGQIAQLFKNRAWHVILDTGLAANEGNFNKVAGNASPYILHIATHGFYIKDTALPTTHRSAGLPLLRNGFLLSGANVFWGTDSVAKNNEDGIVTAQKVANLNFSATSLVTLSACESALGDVNNSEGVYGLQRAFKIAGVQNMLITLWQIPDVETAELMNFFYQEVLNGRSYYTALRNAQLALRAKYPDPAIWAGFELIGQ